MVTSFKYLGRVLLVVDDDWPMVVRNIVNTRTLWWRISRILSREGARLRVSGFFFNAVIQSVLLFNSDSWVVTPHMDRYLRGFQDQVTRILTGRLPWQSLNGRWENTLAEAEKVEAGFETMEIFIIQSPSILQRDWFWNYVRRQRVMRGKRWGYCSGNRQELTWQGKGIWRSRRRMWKKIGWRKMGEGDKTAGWNT